VLDFLSELSKAGVQGVNFHGGPTDVYSPIKYTPAGELSFVSPLYVGLLAWSELVANSSRWLSADVVASAPMKNSWAHATLSTSAGEPTACTVLRVLVIAKDEPNAVSSASMTGDIKVTVSVPPSVIQKPPARAALLYLTAPALSSRSDVDWAGQSWGNRYWNSTDGRPMGERSADVVVAHAAGEYAFTLPQLSAAILLVEEEEDCSGA
jgi:hypothetical protein